MLKVGFASACITPPVGREMPGLFEKRHAEAIEDDLFVRATVLCDDATCIAMAQVDCIALPDVLVTAARREAERLCGIPAAACMIAATHTHSGGPTAGCFNSAPDSAYRDEVVGQIASAIAQAYRALRPALVSTMTSSAPGVAYNRRFLMRDGTQRTHPGKRNEDIDCPVGPEDPTVTVVGFRPPNETTPFGCIVHFACHATHMNGLAYSADYPRWVIDTLRAVYGPAFGVVFLNGAAGDVTQVDNRSTRPYEFGPYWCRRTGQSVGAAALQALAMADYYSGASVDVERVRVNLPIREASSAELREARGRARGGADDIEAVYARELLGVEDLRAASPDYRAELQAVRIADAAFWSAPGELFQAFAQNVSHSSHFPYTCCVSLANGYAGYICTPGSFAGGGYEIRTARSSFLAPDAGDRIVRAASRLLGKLHERGRVELEALPGRLAEIGGDDSALDGLRAATRKRQ
ncbi:MAG: hypothetical protein RBU21_19815 [FCB group bacterium]|jgi:hypothetical protein|nr:hypothetical protein [FCB group bacterium]